jgi:NAD(P)-dependent dehydrogenase (short-subunit alcohol dehydrogenase family)
MSAPASTVVPRFGDDQRQMSELRFDDRVAIVTGAGAAAGLGRAYALELAARGARVVVNDLGVGPDGEGIELADADVVAAEIERAGGIAIADTHSVSQEDSAKAVVETALDAWGRVDILINNAGVVRPGEFQALASEDITTMISVHLLGNVWMSRAVWPHMTTQGYGRIVNVVSGAMWGARNFVIYGAAKAGIFGLTRGLALEGAPSGIRANALAPFATTTAFYYFNEVDAAVPDRSPAAVAPVAAYLSHEDCSLTGEYVHAGGGHVSVGVLGETVGYGQAHLTAEAIRDNLEVVCSPDGFAPFPSPVEKDVEGGGGPMRIVLKREFRRR